MITANDFYFMVRMLGDQATDDILWSESLCPPSHPVEFAKEAIFVICNSGMKNTIAAKIYARVMDALFEELPVIDIFKHAGKASAIEVIWRDRASLLDDYNEAKDKVAFCESLPWIGGITKYHLAKNFGADVAKPDVHLQRLADREGCTAQALCERLAAEVGLRVATVDTVLWRACANGVLDSRTGELRP